MRRITGALVVFVALSVGAAANAATFLAADESRNEAQVNATRSSKSVQHLTHSAGLQSMARAQAVRMMQKGDIFHNPNLSAEVTALGVNWHMVGENVGMGPDEDTIEAALLKSPHHYENIVRPNFNNIGVGIVKGSNGMVYLVQVFAEVVSTSSPAAPRPAPATPRPVRRAAPAPVNTVKTVKAARGPAAPVVHTAVRSTQVSRPDPNALLGGRVVTAD